MKDLEQHSKSHNKSGALWQSNKARSGTDETLQQSRLTAQGELSIKAVEGLSIDFKQVDGKTVSQAIDAMVKADPELAWLKAMQQRGDVDWRKVRELHDSFKHSQSGLGVAAQLIIAILMSAVVGPMAMGAMGGAATSAAATSLATTGAISTINNKGNLGAVARDVTSKDAIKGYAISGITAGLTSGLYDGWTGTETASHATTTTTNTGALTNSATVATTDGLSTWSGIGQFAANQALQNTTSAALGKLLGQGDSFSDALQRTLANTFMAAGFNWVGDVSHGQLDNGSLTKAGLHAVMGGLAAEAMGGDFKTGALAAGVNELVVAKLDAQYKKMGVEDRKNLLHMSSQVLGVLTASLQGGDAKAMQVGAAVAGGATAYNYLQHQEPEQLAKALVECRGASNPAECRAEVQGHYWALSDSRHGSKIYRCVEHGVQACSQQLIDALGGSASLDGLVQQTRFTDEERNILLDFQSRNYDDDFTARVAEMQAVGAIATSVIIPAGAALRRPPGTTENGAKGIGGTVDRGTTGIEWGKGIQGQGMPWENYLSSQLPAGSRLPPNFKTFDFFDNASGVAISAKTLDTTTMAKIANPSQVYSSLKGNIDATVKFTEYSLGRTTLSSSQITARELQVAIPKGTTTAQWEQINRAVQYGQSKGVNVKITTVD